MNEEMKETAISYAKLAALLGFMAFLFINLLAGGVITIALGSIAIRMITGV